jgi:hypothetical protein
MDDNVRHAERRIWDTSAAGLEADAGGLDADAWSFDADAWSFDADAWGASPNWDPSDGQSLYDDDGLDAELVPQARSLFAVPD